MAGINVGLHVVKSNMDFDCFDFFYAFFVRMWLFDAPKRGTLSLIYV